MYIIYPMEVTMKKIVFVVVLTLALVGVLSTTGCKKVELDGLEFFLVEGSGSYSSLDNTSTLKINTRISINQSDITENEPLKASLLLWQIVLITPDNTLSLELTNDNYRSVLGNVFASISNWQEDWLWIELEVPSVDGDLFKGVDPEQMQLSLLVEDNEGNTYTLGVAAQFEFTRE